MSYSKVLDVGQISSVVNVPFRLTGKVILDAIPTNQNLIAGSSNELRILIKNEGTADANGATITITDVTEGTTTAAVSDSINDTDTSRFESDSTTNATTILTETDEQPTSQSSAINLRT